MIRLGALPDVPRLIKLAHHFLAGTIYGELLTLSDDHIEALIHVALSRGVIFVWENPAGTVVGFIAMAGPFEHQLSGDSFAEELAWWVEPDQRRAAIGRALLAEAEAWAIGAGICVLKMIAPTGSGIGRYYESLGYRPLETAYMKRL